MEYVVFSGHVDAPLAEHQMLGSFPGVEEALQAAEQEAQAQRTRYAAMVENANAEVVVATEPADDVLFILVDGRPRWRIAVALQMRLFGTGDLLDELVRDIDRAQPPRDQPEEES